MMEKKDGKSVIHGFIEVSGEDSHSKYLINIQKISRIVKIKDQVYIVYEIESDYLVCAESYEEILVKMREAAN